MRNFKSYLKNPHVQHWSSLLALLAISVFAATVHYETKLLLTSLTEVEEHDPFDGTVLPIEKAPDWTDLSSEEEELTYPELPQSKLDPLPEYRTDYLTFPSEDLEWGNKEHDAIRNTKITYPVPYAGNYDFDDCGEGCGSHPAVDIKVPMETPVYAVANGIVDKAGSSSGFGKHIVLQHNGVPDPNQPDQTTTLYSSYSHLSEFFVTEGQEVHKGEVIGEVGDSGSATTYHLHFQLDSEEAPWHPYWPFTTAEASAAGYSFWEAVNYKVGMDNVYRYTYNPMEWVQSYLDGAEVVEVVEEEEVEEEVEVEVEEEEIEETEKIVTVLTIDFSDLDIESPAFLMPGQNKTITLRLLDSAGEVMKNGSFDGQIDLEVSDSSVAKLNRNFVESIDFSDGESELSLYADQDGSVTVNAEIADQVYESSPIYIVSAIEPFAQFGVAHDGSFVPGQEETIQILALDLNGNPTPGFYGNGTLYISLVQGSGSFSKDALTKKDFATGIAELTFIADSDDPVIIRVTYGTKVVESETLIAHLFDDISEDHEYYQAVAYLYAKGTIQGYPDGSFKPENTVNRIEALKFIFSGLDQEVLSGLSTSFNDTQNGQWYSDYLATATSLGVVQGYGDGSFRPTQGVNRVEFLKMLFSTVDVSIDPVVVEDPYKDVNNLSWYAPYVEYAKEKNIFPVSGQYFDPSEEMSRAEVAEVIYRMIAVSQNGGASYTTLMEVE